MGSYCRVLIRGVARFNLSFNKIIPMSIESWSLEKWEVAREEAHLYFGETELRPRS